MKEGLVRIDLDFGDPSAVEQALIKSANELIGNDSESAKTVGRALLALAPAWVSYIVEEMKVDNPSSTLFGLTRAMGVLNGMLISAATGPITNKDMLIKLADLFGNTMIETLASAKQKDSGELLTTMRDGINKTDKTTIH